jgi:hypothetical protein
LGKRQQPEDLRMLEYMANIKLFIQLEDIGTLHFLCKTEMVLLEQIPDLHG